MSAPKPSSRAAQAADVLRQEVLAKGPGTRLSSVRELKARLGFSQASLVAAFEQLEREGLIVRRHGSGVYASHQAGQIRAAVFMDPKFLLLANRSPVWHLILNALCKSSERRGWDCALHLGAFVPPVSGYGAFSPEAVPSALVSDLENKRLSGVAAIGVCQGAVNVISSYGVPVVALSGYGQANVEFHHQGLLSQGLSVLSSQGAARVHVLASRVWDLQNLDGLAVKAGIPAKAVLLGEAEPAERPLKSADPIQLGWQWAKDAELLPGDALLSCDDMLSVGIIMGLYSRGIIPGRDFLMATQSNKGSSTLKGWEQSLIRLEYDPQLVAETMFDLLELAVTLGSWSAVEAANPPTDKLSEGGELIYRLSPQLVLPG